MIVFVIVIYITLLLTDLECRPGFMPTFTGTALCGLMQFWKWG